MPLSVDKAPVRIGVAGLGRAGTFHLERLGLREDLRVVALYDDCPAVRARAGAAAGRIHTSWSDFLADGEIELVLVAAPPALHAELTIASLAAGKHVVVETPLCLNLAEGAAVAAAAQRAGRTVCVAQTRRWSDDFRMAQRTLANGELGELQAIKFVNWQYNPRTPASGARSGEKGAPLGEPAFDWRSHAATGGGLLWEFGSHLFDQMLLLAGRPAETVFARLAPSSAGDCDDGFLAVVTFAGGLTAHIEASRIAAAPLCSGWMLAGARGSYAGLTQYVPNRVGEVVDIPLEPVVSHVDEFYQQVGAHLRSGGANPAGLDGARQAIAIIEAARRSHRTGQVVAVER